MSKNKSELLGNKHAKNVLFSLVNKTLEEVKYYNYLGEMICSGPYHDFTMATDIRETATLGRPYVDTDPMFQKKAINTKRNENTTWIEDRSHPECKK